MSSFNYRGIGINYEDRGCGQPLIFLHGYGASTYSWRYVLPHFSQSYRVMALDLKGFGLSDKPMDEKYSVWDQSRIIYEFILTHNLNNVILVGNSLGGAVSIFTYLMQYDNCTHYISKLILIDSAGYEQKLPNLFAILKVPVINMLAVSLINNRLKVKMVLRDVFYDDTKITEEMIAVYSGYLSLPGAYHAVIKTAEQILPPNPKEIIARYKNIMIPVLLIWGEKDEVIPLDIGKKLAESMPNSKLVVIPNCGHAPQEECPGKAIEAMEHFLSNQTKDI
jgi:pimeloyl-ACP methyl ester carboxylesterase